MLSSYLSQVNPLFAGPLTREAILLVESNPVLSESRTRLLLALNLPVLKASCYCEGCRLPKSTSIGAAISLLPSEAETQKVAAHVRRQWPSAKVLPLGTLRAQFDDPRYDEIVYPGFNSSGLLEASRRLLSSIRPNMPIQHASE
jgi:hypothetical protein